MYTTCCLVVIHPFAKIWHAYVKSKEALPNSNSLSKYNFDIEVKGQGQTEFRKVCDTSYHGDTLTCITKYVDVKGQKRRGLNTKSCHKPFKFDLEVKGQGHIRIMNVLDTFSHGDRPMCQIWYANAVSYTHLTLPTICSV